MGTQHYKATRKVVLTKHSFELLIICSLEDDESFDVCRL